MKRLFRLALVALALPAAACGARTATSAGAAPLADGAAAYLVTGDADAAKTSLERAAAAGSAAAAFLLGDLLDATGRPDLALTYYLDALRLVHDGADGGLAAIAAAMATVTIRDRVEGFEGRLDAFLGTIGKAPGALPAEAWYQIANLELALARRRGREADAARSLAALGCPTTWDIAGPRGPYAWLDFGAPFPAGTGRSLPEIVDLGPGRGPWPVRRVSTDICLVPVANPALPLPGTSTSRTVVAVERSMTALFRLQTSSAAVVRVASTEVFRRDPRRFALPRVAWFAVDLSAGAVDVEVALGGDEPAQGFSLLIVDAHGSPAFAAHGPKLLPLSPAPAKDRAAALPDWAPALSGSAQPARVPAEDARATRYARLKIALFFDDIDGASRLAEDLAAGAPSPAPALLMALAEANGADPDLPGEVGYERARALEEQALAREPRLWQARIDLAGREMSESRPSRAVALLEAGLALTPEEPSIPRRLAETMLGEGWLAEARQAIGALRALLPTTCSTISLELSAARQASDIAAAARLAAELTACDRASPALAEELVRAGRYAEALADARRRAFADRNSAAPSLEVAEVAESGNDLAAARDSLERALALAPANSDLRLHLTDLLAASGDRAQAMRTLEQGLDNPFMDYSDIEKYLSYLDGLPPLQDLRLDGRQLIDAYRARGVAYDTAAVYVLDRAVYRVSLSGALTVLVHVITHLKSDEAVETHGELRLPERATLLTARTIKADGRVLEPEEHAGKDSLSFPDLEPGDFIETEYIEHRSPNQMFPGGFDTERFYFQDFETAFHQSEMVVMVPAGMEVQLDPRGSCPAPLERRSGEWRTLTWRARGALPAPEEPLGPVSDEVLPSIRVVARASFESVLMRMRDLLAPNLRTGRHVAAALEGIMRDLPPGDERARRRAIYRFVLDSIESDEDLFAPASHIIVRRAGNRTRAFLALLQAAGCEAKLALVRSSRADATSTAAPAFGIFDRMLAFVPQDGFVSLDQPGAPYGYLPPELRFRPAVVVETGEASTTDGGAVPRDTQRIEARLALDADGAARGAVREVLEGSLAAAWRDAFLRTPVDERERLFQESYLGKGISGSSLRALRFEGLEDPQRPLVVEYDVELDGLGLREGDRLRVALPFSITLVKQTGGLPERRTPLVLASRITKTVAVTLAVPKGWRLHRGPEAFGAVAGEWGRLASGAEARDATVTLRYEAELTADRVAPADYPRFLEFANRVDDLSELRFALVP